MSKIIAVHKDQLVIPAERQRTDVDSVYITELSDSISRIGVIHPMVVNLLPSGKASLVAGFCRSKAIEQCWIMGLPVRFAGEEIPSNGYPCIQLKDLDPIDAFEIELEENIRRKDISWQDKAQATTKLLELRTIQAQRKSEPPPTVADIAKELRGTSGGAHDITRKELLVARHLDNPEVAKATSVDQAFKVLKRQEELKRSEELGKQVGATFSSAAHALLKGSCLEHMKGMIELFDVILTDPPYGIGADEFSDSGGKTPGEHFYKDDAESFSKLLSASAPLMYQAAKPQAHLYLFCDIEHFLWLRSEFSSAGWKVFRTPLIWNNPTAMRLPWIDQGPQRKYQICLYAVKGSKPVNAIAPDLVSYPSDENLNHPAQKPVALYRDLLQRSTRPGDTVLDPFCGSGTIFPAAHSLKCKATGIELDPKAYGISVARLGDLK